MRIMHELHELLNHCRFDQMAMSPSRGKTLANPHHDSEVESTNGILFVLLV